MNVPNGIWLFLTKIQAHCSGFGAQQASTSEPYGKVSQSRSMAGLWLTESTPKARNSLYTFPRSNNDYNGDYREAKLVWKVAAGLEESSWQALWGEKASALPSHPHSYDQRGEQCTSSQQPLKNYMRANSFQRETGAHINKGALQRSTSWHVVAPMLWPSSA